MSAIPRGIEVLVKKAAVDADFRRELLSRRSAAAELIDLKLTTAEASMLDSIPAGQLEAIIARTQVDPPLRPVFMGKASTLMLIALGAGLAVASIACPSLGVRPDERQRVLEAMSRAKAVKEASDSNLGATTTATAPAAPEKP